MSTCSHVILTGKNKGQLCKNKATQSNYCGAHHKMMNKKVDRKKGSQSLHEDAIFRNPNSETKKPKRKIRYSSFLITVNSQKDFQTMTAEAKKEFKDFVDFVFSPDEIRNFLTDTTSSDVDKNIVKLTIEHHFEIGEKNGRLHMHAILNIEHTGNFRLEANNIRQVAQRILGYKIHLDVRGSGNPTKAMEQYASKNSNRVIIF